MDILLLTKLIPIPTMVTPSWVGTYKAEEIDLDDLARKAQAIFQKKPLYGNLRLLRQS